MSKDNNIAIKVEDLSKSFHLPHNRQNSIKGRLINLLKGGDRSYEVQKVLRNISFDINKGDFFGIVGRNGSGKSTLLKLIAGIYNPDKGKISINGSLVPFIELGVGFNPELTGRENVFLNGALLGFSHGEMEKMYSDIVEFAELERFMDQKLKNYSSGMQVRLAFSVAIRAETDILVLDEVLAVGDADFQQKCFDYFSSLKNAKKTVILVSHSMSSIERYCSRALLLENGKIVSIGKSSDIAYEYENLFISDSNDKLPADKAEEDRKGNNKSLISASVNIFQNGSRASVVKALEDFVVRVRVGNMATDLENINIGINLRDSEDRIVFSTNTRKSLKLLMLKSNGHLDIEFHIENYYTNGKYYVDVMVVDERSMSDKLLYKEKAVGSFDVKGIREHEHSLFHPKFSIKLIDDREKTN